MKTEAQKKRAVAKLEKKFAVASKFMEPIIGKRIIGYHADDVGGVDLIRVEGGYWLEARNTSKPSVRVVKEKSSCL